MARLTREQYLEIIDSYPWSNLNKEITGDVLRQFISNILDSTSEMHLRDGQSIEESIAALRNSGAAGEFSEQFKIISNVIWLNLKYISANNYEEPEPVIPVETGNFIVKETDTYIPYWDPDTFVDIDYDSETGINSISVLQNWNIVGGLLGSLGMGVPAGFIFDTEQLNDFNAETGRYGYLRFQFKGNENVKNHAIPIDIGVYIKTNKGNFPMRVRLFRDEDWHYATFRWYVSTGALLSGIDFLAGLFQVTEPHTIVAGCVFYIKNVELFKDEA